MHRRFLRLGFCISMLADFTLRCCSQRLSYLNLALCAGLVHRSYRQLVQAFARRHDGHNFLKTVIMRTPESAMGAGGYN